MKPDNRPHGQRDNRTGEQRRADLRAEVSDAVGAALIHCDRSARAIWAATLDVSTTHLDNCVSGTKALHVADALAAPEPVRHALAQLLAGDAHVVVELPAIADASDDWRLVATAQRESGEAIAATLDAFADGRVTAAEGARLEREADEAIAALLGIRERARAARRERVVGIRGRVTA